MRLSYSAKIISQIYIAHAKKHIMKITRAIFPHFAFVSYACVTKFDDMRSNLCMHDDIMDASHHISRHRERSWWCGKNSNPQ